jgi:hypothetical protein
MYARVAKWEGATGDAVRTMADRIKADADSGPPDGVPANGFLLLVDPDNGRSMAISFYETEENRRQGDETLNAMNPPEDADMGSRTGVEMYEVAVDVKS